MNGQVLHFSIETQSGIILGDDGNRYDFARAEWMGTLDPGRGARVDFEAEGGNAVAVRPALESIPAGAVSGGEITNLHADSYSLPTYIVARLLLGVGLLFVLTLLVFTLTQVAPGEDPLLYRVGETVTAGEIQALRERLGLDRPLPIRYLTWVGNMLKGDFGHSWFADAPVGALIRDRLPSTLSLLPLTMFFAAAISIPLGILAAARRGSWFDRVAGGAAAFGVGAPSFWVALILLSVFVLSLRWFPTPPLGGGGLQHLILPSLVLGMLSGAVLIRVIRSSIVEVLDRPAIGPTGLDSEPPVAACLARCLGNLLIWTPALFGGFLAGAVVVELVFLIPGIGILLAQAVIQRDFPVVEGVVMAVAGMMAIVLGLSLAAGFLVRWLESEAATRSDSEVSARPWDTSQETPSPSVPLRVPWVAVVVLVILILAAVFAPLIAPHDPLQTSEANRLLSPGDGHPLGADKLGRDILSRLIYGARTGLAVALLSLIPVGVVGGGLGLVSAYAGGKADTIIMGAVDNILAFPLILVAVLAMAALGSGTLNIVVAATLALWPKVARVTRDEATALKAGGNLDPPRVFSAVMTLLTLHVGLAILLEATLSFLGVGTPQPQPSWGSMLAEARELLLVAPRLVVFPGLALTVVTVALLASPFRWWKI